MIGIVAALTEELTALERRLAPSRHRRVGGRRVLVGELGGRPVCLMAAGVGRRRAEHGLEALMEATPLEALLGVGVAGALSEDLAVADLVRARVVVGPEGERLAPPPWRWGADGGSASPASGTLVTVDEIVNEADAKRRLAERLEIEPPAAVDLESAAWARVADRRELPWCIVRAVSDLIDETLPVDFERFRTPTGEIARARLAAHALARPGLIPQLDRLRRRVRRCADRLADAAEELVAC